MSYHGCMVSAVKRIATATVAGLATLVLSGCGTIRLAYEAEIELDDGREGSLRYEDSYDLGGHQIACIVTGILYGGWCWAYLAMPFDAQGAELRRDAEAYVEKKEKSDVTIHYGRAKRVGFDDERRRVSLELSKKPPASPKNQDPQTDEPSRNQDDDEEEESDERQDTARRERRPLRASGVKFFMPGIIGLGIAAEIVEDDFSFEIGTGAMLFTPRSGLYAAGKVPVHKESNYDVRLGLVHMRYADRLGTIPLNGVALEYAKRGLGAEVHYFPRRRPLGCSSGCATEFRPEVIAMLTYRP